MDYVGEDGNLRRKGRKCFAKGAVSGEGQNICNGRRDLIRGMYFVWLRCDEEKEIGLRKRTGSNVIWT